MFEIITADADFENRQSQIALKAASVTKLRKVTTKSLN